MNSAPTDEQDRTDMARLVAGHEAALGDLMERHGEKLFRYLVRSLQSEDEAADLAQETFVRVYQNRAKYDPQLRLSTWLYAIAGNLVRNRYQWRARHPQVSLDAENESSGGSLGDSLPESRPSPSETVQAGERSAAVRRAVTALPEDLREPLILAEYEELSQAEIAVILHCTPKAVEMRLYRARQQLRTSLGRLLETL
jgi:RNA polymerase sigma-70 factor (ECF subfamily)